MPNVEERWLSSTMSDEGTTKMAVTVSTYVQTEATTIRVSGEVDVSNAAQLREAIDSALTSDAANVVVDLGDVPYIDSTGIGVLVGAAHRATDANKTFVVQRPQRNVARVLAMLGVDGELGINV